MAWRRSWVQIPSGPFDSLPGLTTGGHGKPRHIIKVRQNHWTSTRLSSGAQDKLRLSFLSEDSGGFSGKCIFYS